MTRAQPYDGNTALNAAMTLFWQKGYNAASLKALKIEGEREVTSAQLAASAEELAIDIEALRT